MDSKRKQNILNYLRYLRFFTNSSNQRESEVEKGRGSPSILPGYSFSGNPNKKTTGGPDKQRGGNPDDNDEFWKLFMQESRAEAKWKTQIWGAQLDSVLVFSGLFGGIVSAFLIDNRSQVQSNLQLAALTELIHVFRNDTGSFDSNVGLDPSNRLVSILWSISLVFTLIGALWGVMAKGWLGEMLHETAAKPADQALDRWRRDEAIKNWHLAGFITFIPLLIQIGLGLFFAGFVVQSFATDYQTGIGLLFLVSLGALSYAIVTILAPFDPECPLQTPVTKFFRLHHLRIPFPDSANDDANTPKIQFDILMSKLTRSSNDETFCTAASVLNQKLDSNLEIWYKSIKDQELHVSTVLWLRLNSLAQRVETMKDVSRSIVDGETSIGNYSPIDQGIVCLRAILKCMRTGIDRDGIASSSQWTQSVVTNRWISSKTFPETWRILALSIHITALIINKDDIDNNHIVNTSWSAMIREISSNQDLRSISDTTAHMGLLRGQTNLRRACALNLALLFEIEVSDRLAAAISTTDNIGADLWSELVQIWRKEARQLINKEEELNHCSKKSVVSLMACKLYDKEFQSSIPTMIEQLDDPRWNIREQALHFMHDLSKRVEFHSTLKSKEVVGKVVMKLDDEDKDVRWGAVRVLSRFGQINEFHSVLNDEKAVSKIFMKLDDEDEDIRWEAVRALSSFSQIDVLQDAIIAGKGVEKIVAKLVDSSSDVREEAIGALYQIAGLKLYQGDVESSIPIIINQLAHESWNVRLRAIDILMFLVEHDELMNTMKDKGAFTHIIDALEDRDEDIRTEAVRALSLLSKHESLQETLKDENAIFKLCKKLGDSTQSVYSEAISALSLLIRHNFYHNEVISSIPIIIRELEHEDWHIRRGAIRQLTKLSDNGILPGIMTTEGVLKKIITMVRDEDKDVRCEALRTLTLLSGRVSIQKILKAEDAISQVFQSLNDTHPDVRSKAVSTLLEFNKDVLYQSDLTLCVPITIKRLNDPKWDIRPQVIQLLTKLSEDGSVRNMMQTEEAVSMILGMLDENNFRYEAIRALSSFGKNYWFQEILKEKVVPKLCAMLTDSDVHVCTAAASGLVTFNTNKFYQKEILSCQTMSTAMQTILQSLTNPKSHVSSCAIDILKTFAEYDLFQEQMKTEDVVPKLVAKLRDNEEGVCYAVVQTLIKFGNNGKREKFVPTLVEELTRINNDKPVRLLLYQVLKDISADAAAVFKEINSATIRLLEQMESKDLPFLFNSLSILKEFSDEGLDGRDESDATKSSNFHQKMIALREKAIARLIDAVSDSGAVEVILTLATKDDLRKDLERVIPKIIQRLSTTDEDEQYPVNLIEALSNLAQYKEFKMKMKSVVPILLKRLEKDLSKGTMKDGDREITFHHAACKFISQLCEEKIVGRDVVPQLICVLSYKNLAVIEDILGVLFVILDKASDSLTRSDCIALASSLRIFQVEVPTDLEVQLWKLQAAAKINKLMRIRLSETSNRRLDELTR